MTNLENLRKLARSLKSERMHAYLVGDLVESAIDEIEHLRSSIGHDSLHQEKDVHCGARSGEGCRHVTGGPRYPCQYCELELRYHKLETDKLAMEHQAAERHCGSDGECAQVRDCVGCTECCDPRRYGIESRYRCNGTGKVGELCEFHVVRQQRDEYDALRLRVLRTMALQEMADVSGDEAELNCLHQQLELAKARFRDIAHIESSYEGHHERYLLDTVVNLASATLDAINTARERETRK